MISFESDYTAAGHGKILQRLNDMQNVRLMGYGCDELCEQAKEKIRIACGCPEADVSFLVGGTQTNATVIDSLLKSYEGVVAAETGHVSVHEAGAIEFTGHKVLTLPQQNGKICAEDLTKLLKTFYGDESYEHMVFPGMVYISYPTEYGTLYSKAELSAIYEVCKEYEIPLYIDGARLGYGLMSRQADLTLKELAQLCDAFYIGGTKVGALFGEAVVFPKGNAPKHFMTLIKQHGALLAKGWLLGLQFDELFTDDLYFRISRHAIDMAEQLKAAFLKKGYRLYLDSPTNQQFVILQNDFLEKLRREVSVTFWEKYDEEHTVVRFATSWSTSQEDVDALIGLL